MKKLIALWLILINHAALSAEYTAFELEPRNKLTVISNASIVQGSQLNLKISRMIKNELLLLYKCGSSCNTAKLVAKWTPEDIDKKINFLIEDNGDYYLWIMKKLETGEVGPSFILSFTGEPKKYSVMTYTGSMFEFNVQSP